ncbi:glycosyltransferase family 2 protein [Salegentibacter sp. HM20]
MAKLVSIITPVYNREEFLSEMIESVIAQTYTNWELLLVDDGSTDKSWQIMKAYAEADHRIQVLKRPKERFKGANAARNYGFEKSKGSFINWFDSDDKMHPEFIERKVKSFIAAKNLDVVFSKTIRTNFQDLEIYDRRLKCSKNLLRDYILRKISWYMPDGMFCRSYLVNKSLFNENLLAGQDRDFYIRLFCQELPKIKILDFHATFYRIHSSSISDNIYRKGNSRMQLSHYNSLVNQIKLLEQNGLLDGELKYHYLKEISKRLPAVIKTDSSLNEYIGVLMNISEGNMQSSKIWGKLIISYFSFKVFGKGEKFLR